MKIEKLVNSIAQQKIIILGLVLIIAGNTFEATVIKIKIDSVIANIGSIFLVVGTVQWIFDETARRELIYELFRSIRGDDRIHRNGLMDCEINSRDVSEHEEWLKADTLIVGIHYSSRFLKDNANIIKNRIQNKKTTIICHVGIRTYASKYLKESASGLSDPEESIKKLNRLVQSEFNSQYLELIEHNRILRYTFIYTENSVWIKFFTNAEGFAIVPAFKIKCGTPLFDFFEKDINNLGALK